jgi:hypothetical protein
MTYDEIRTLYRHHQLIEAIADPTLPDGRWSLACRDIRGGFIPLSDPYGEAYHYQNLELVFRSDRRVGFKQVRVEIVVK